MNSPSFPSTTRPCVVVTHAKLSETGRSVLEAAGYEVVFVPKETAQDEVVKRLSQCDVHAILARGGVSARAIAACPSLKVISRHGAGYDTVDIAAATARGIPVLVAAGANSPAVAELTIGLMIATARNFPLHFRANASGEWSKLQQGIQLGGRTLGLLGYGAISRKVGRMALAMGMELAFFDPYAAEGTEDGAQRMASLDELLVRSQVLSLHCPLNERTRHIIGQRELGLLPRGAIVVNTARGGLIDQTALITALESGHLGGAGLDTFELEPLPVDSPLRRMDNVVGTPHVGAQTVDTQAHVARVAAENILRVIRGEAVEPACLINPEVFTSDKHAQHASVAA